MVAPNYDDGPVRTNQVSELMRASNSELSVEDALGLLTSGRRRRLLRYLLEETEDGDDLGAIAAHLARDDPLDKPTIEATLVHLHLPKCADAGVLEYDHRSGTVRLTEAAAELKPLLDACDAWEGSRA